MNNAWTRQTDRQTDAHTQPVNEADGRADQETHRKADSSPVNDEPFGIDLNI